MIMMHTLAVQGAVLTDRVTLAQQQVANAAGGGAGQTVTVAVTFAEPMPSANYTVLFDAGQDAVCFATSKTAEGFTLNINPRLAANTVAAGTVNVLAIE